MSIWIATLLAAATAVLAQLIVPRRLWGRRSDAVSQAQTQPRTSTTQALVLLAEASAWAMLVAVVAALAMSTMDTAWAVNSSMVMIAIALLAAAMTTAVIVALAPARAEIRLERRIAKLTKAASAGALPPLPPSHEMQALMEPIASVNRDIAALERAADGNAPAAELADLRKMRDGLVELFVEKDLARRIDTLRFKALARKPKRRSIGWLESLAAVLLRDRLVGSVPAPAAAGLALGLYTLSALASAWLASQPGTELLAERIQSRASEIILAAEARQLAPEPDAGAEQPPVLPAIRTANLAIDRLSDTPGIAIDAAFPASATRDAAAEQEIAALTRKLAETEAKLERAEQALREAKVERQRLLDEAERTRDVDVATVASNAQLEHMAHEAAMAVEEERLHQRELELAQRLVELEETKAALRAEKQQLVAMIEDRRRQAQMWEARVRLERITAAAEARIAERRTIADGAREARRFELEARRIEESRLTIEIADVGIADRAQPDRAETATYVPASAPLGTDNVSELVEPSEPAKPPSTWHVAAVDSIDARTYREAGPPAEQTIASSTITLPAAQGATTDGPSAEVPPLSPLAELECGRVRAEAASLGADASIGAPGSTTSHKPKLSLAVARALLDCGQALMIAGELTAARIAFEKVAAAGIAKGALALGTTFDPHALAKANLDGASSNTKLARFWYKRALTLSGQ